jgi:hypothetical protein
MMKFILPNDKPIEREPEIELNLVRSSFGDIQLTGTSPGGPVWVLLTFARFDGSLTLNRAGLRGAGLHLKGTND